MSESPQARHEGAQSAREGERYRYRRVLRSWHGSFAFGRSAFAYGFYWRENRDPPRGVWVSCGVCGLSFESVSADVFLSRSHWPCEGASCARDGSRMPTLPGVGLCGARFRVLTELWHERQSWAEGRS